MAYTPTTTEPSSGSTSGHNEDVSDDAWSSEETVRRRLGAWWKNLRPDLRRRALAEADRTLPEWLAHDLVRAGLPLDNNNPGLAHPSVAGQFQAPPGLTEFLNAKRAHPARKW